MTGINKYATFVIYKKHTRVLYKSRLTILMCHNFPHKRIRIFFLNNSKFKIQTMEIKTCSSIFSSNQLSMEKIF